MYRKLLVLLALCNFLLLPVYSDLTKTKEVKESNLLEMTPSTLNGLDADFLKKLVNLFQVDVFVETGTYLGDTSYEGSKVFKEVYTIENNHKLFTKAQKRFKNTPNVHCWEGSSPLVLKKNLAKIKGRILFWLDSHNALGTTQKDLVGKTTREELAAIKAAGIQNAVILIDNIQMFHVSSQDAFSLEEPFSTLQDLRSAIADVNPNYEFWILGNIAIAYPKEDQIKVSPLVKACTQSCLFDSQKSNTEENIIETEQVIMHSFKGTEGKILDGLHNAYEAQRKSYITTLSEDPYVHYVLWKGLALLGQKDYFQASKCFHSALAKGCSHWRVYWYIALSEYERRNFAEAERALKHVLKEAPEFKQAYDLSQKIKEKTA